MEATEMAFSLFTMFFLGIFGIQNELQYPGVLSKIIRTSFIQNEVFPSFFIGQDTVETVL